MGLMKPRLKAEVHDANGSMRILGVGVGMFAKPGHHIINHNSMLSVSRIRRQSLRVDRYVTIWE